MTNNYEPEEGSGLVIFNWDFLQQHPEYEAVTVEFHQPIVQLTKFPYLEEINGQRNPCLAGSIDGVEVDTWYIDGESTREDSLNLVLRRKPIIKWFNFRMGGYLSSAYITQKEAIRDYQVAEDMDDEIPYLLRIEYSGEGMPPVKSEIIPPDK